MATGTVSTQHGIDCGEDTIGTQPDPQIVLRMHPEDSIVLRVDEDLRRKEGILPHRGVFVHEAEASRERLLWVSGELGSLEAALVGTPRPQLLRMIERHSNDFDPSLVELRALPIELDQLDAAGDSPHSAE
jgi:hypothetical protein